MMKFLWFAILISVVFCQDEDITCTKTYCEVRVISFLWFITKNTMFIVTFSYFKVNTTNNVLPLQIIIYCYHNQCYIYIYSSFFAQSRHEY